MMPKETSEKPQTSLQISVELLQNLSELVDVTAKADFLTYIRKQAPKIVPDFLMGHKGGEHMQETYGLPTPTFY